jgi:hypothetical protein
MGLIESEVKEGNTKQVETRIAVGTHGCAFQMAETRGEICGKTALAAVVEETSGRGILRSYWVWH